MATSSSKKGKTTEYAYISVQLEDTGRVGVPSVSVSLPSDDAGEIVQHGLSLWRELHKLSEAGALSGKVFQDLRDLTDDMEEALLGGGVFAAFETPTEEDDD